MCRSAADADAMLGISANPHDPTARQEPVADYLAGSDRDLRNVRIGIDPAYTSEGVDAVMSAAMQHASNVFAGLGAELRSVKFPDPQDVIRDWGAQCAVETAAAHAATYPSQAKAYGPGPGGLIAMGREMKALDLQEVWKRRRRFTGRVAALFETIDLLLMPAQPIASPTKAQMETLGQDPNAFEVLVKFTAPFNTTGSPTITFPAGFTRQGTPVAMQLVARHLDEALLVRAGRALQREDRLAPQASAIAALKRPATAGRPRHRAA